MKNGPPPPWIAALGVSLVWMAFRMGWVSPDIMCALDAGLASMAVWAATYQAAKWLNSKCRS